MTMRVETKTNTDGRLDYLTVYRKGRKAVHLHFVYGHDGFLSDIEFTGKKEDMPDIPTIVELVNEKFMERIGIIENIDSVDLIDIINKIIEITLIKNIETIGNIPDPTPKGSAGIAFQQTTPTAGDVGAWLSPTGHEAGSGWTSEAQAYDDNLATGAEMFMASAGWTPFLILTIAATTSNKLRFQSGHYDYAGSSIDVDVYKDGAWVDVYDGAYTSFNWIEKTFAQGSVTKARVRFYCLNDDSWMILLEFDFWQVIGAGGTGGVLMVAGSYLTPTLYNVTMTLANTEYLQALPAKTKRFSIKTRDGTAFRTAFVTGKVATPTAPYQTVPANWEYYEDLLYVTGLTLYFGCGVAGKIVEITVWT